MSYLYLLKVVGPEAIIVVTALIVLAVDLLKLRERPVATRFKAGAALAGLGCLGAAMWLISSTASGEALGLFMDDSLTRIVKISLLVLAFCAVTISIGGNFTEHVGEYLSLILLGTVGMMMLVSSTDLLMIFIALELTSLSLYVLAAFNKHSIKSAEAALKYFLFGGMSAAFTLFGLSLVYGLSGSTNLKQIAEHFTVAGQSPDPLLIAALVMTVVGFGFKVAAVPFHFWAPDAYQGAPTPSVVLIASGSKVASFFVLARLLITGFAQAGGSGAWHQYAAGWVPVLAVMAAASMVLGNLAALAQSNVKRLLAYSAIAQAGYTLLGLLAGDLQGMSSLIYYAVTYGLTVAGAFGVVMAVEQRTGGSNLADFAGLGKREPLLSFCLMIFMLSLAGIPPLAGFFGKFYLFTAAAGGAKNLGLLWLVFLAVAMSAVSLYYYLQVLKQVYVTPAPVENVVARASWSGRIIVALLAVGVVALGCAPDLLLRPLLDSLRASGF